MFSLETVKVKTPFCNNDAAVIACSDNESNIVDGKIIRPHQNSITILFNPLTPSIGLRLGSYTIIYEKNITDYSIRVTLTFHELVDFNGTALQCGHKYMFMDFQYRGK